jgi:hypothetical protein
MRRVADQKKKPGKGCPASLNTALQKSNAALFTAAKKRRYHHD